MSAKLSDDTWPGAAANHSRPIGLPPDHLPGGPVLHPILPPPLATINSAFTILDTGLGGFAPTWNVNLQPGPKPGLSNES
jgi:hypothetical protein